MLALPLVVQDGLIGLLAVYPRRPRRLTPNESTLLVALAVQLAVAVQNARLHERASSSGRELEKALAAEREAAKRLRALYEISRTFAQSLSLQTTLDVLARSIVTLLGVDAAVIRMPDERGVDCSSRARSRHDQRVDEAAAGAARRPQPLYAAQRGGSASGEPLVLDARSADALGGRARRCWCRSSRRARPRRSSRSRPPAELLATLTLVSLDPERPSRARSPTPRARSPGRRRSRSTTPAFTSSRRSSPTRCSARCCRGSSPTSRGSRSATSTSRRHASRSAATSTTT